MLVTMAQNGKDFENIMLILYEFQICLVFQNVAISFAVSAYNWYAEMKLTFLKNCIAY